MAFLRVFKAALMFACVALALFGGVQILRGLGVAVPMPEVSLFDAVTFGAGPLPAGVVVTIIAVLLIVALAKWELREETQWSETKPDGTRVSFTRTTQAMRDIPKYD